MVIFYDNQIFNLQKYGGISRYFVELAKAINLQNKHHVYILGGINNNEYLGQEKNHFIKGFHYQESIGKIIKNKFYDFTGTLQELVMKWSIMTLKKPNLIHETYYQPGASFKYKVPVIITIHDLIYEKYREQFIGGEEIISSKKNSIRRASHIITVSNNTKKDLMDIYNVSPDKITVVYHGLTIFPALKEKVNIREPYILYVGRREGYKNFKFLLNVFISNKEFSSKYKLICFGGGSFTDSEIDIIRKNNMMDKVLYMEGNDSLLATLYSGAKVFVYPSLYEGFGMSPLEAMQYGCPVICSNTSSIPEVVGQAARLFDPSNEKELSTALSEVLNNDMLRNKFIEKGKEHVKNFTWHKTAEKTLEVYQKAIV